MNQSNFAGHLGKAPELSHLSASGAVYTDLAIATNEHWTSQNGEKKTRTNWHYVRLWGKDAENACKYLEKGRFVIIENAKHRSFNWVDSEGVQRFSSRFEAAPDTRVTYGPKIKDRASDEAAPSDLPSLDNIPF